MTQSNSPIIYVDGIRIQSTAFQQETFGDSRPRVSGITPSPLNSINPNDIERIEVIKGAAASTLYGTEASAGVIQIFTKKGSTGAPIWEAEIQQGALKMRKFGPEAEPYLRMDHWLKTGHTQQYSASVRAGTELLQYFLSGQHSDDTGTLPDNTGETWAVRGNFSATPAGGLTFQWNSAYTGQHLGTTAVCGCGEGLVLNAVQAEVNYYGTADPDVISQSLQWHIDHFIDRFTTGGTVTYSPLASLTNRVTVGFDYSQSEERNFRPVGFPFWPLGALYVSKFENRQTTFDYVGTYRFNITNALSSNFSWGGQAVGKEAQTNAAWGEEFPGAALPTTSSAAKTTAYENLSKIWNAGFFLQNIFGFSDRYFVTLGMRVDGNSAFGSGFGLQMYPKASASWVISDESWWRESFGQLKLRTAYGRSGQAPGAFDAVRTWQGQGFVGATAFTPRNVGNPDLGPEVSAEFEAGFDASWFGDRLSSNFTYFQQTTSDALFNVTNIPSKGFLGSQRLNVGKTRSSGIELSVNAGLIERAAFSWDVGLDVTTAHSKVLDLGGGPSFSVGSDNWVVLGEPAPVRRGRIVTNPDAIADPIYKDSIIGPALPTHILGMSTTIRVPAGVTLSFRGDYRGGNYYYGNAPIERSVRWPRCYPYYQHPQGLQPDGQNNLTLKSDTPALWRARCSPTAFGHDIWMVPADYFRVRSIAANIPVGFAFPDRVKNSTLTLGAYNWFTWYNKDFLDYDPEEGSTEGLTSSSGPPSLGTNISWRASLNIRF
jgi:TonB-dependent starch-binding outer membrane protein SusC